MQTERGTTVIKQALRAPEWQSREAQQKLAWTAGIGQHALEAFCYSRAQLAPDALKALTHAIWSGKLEYDPRHNELVVARDHAREKV